MLRAANSTCGVGVADVASIVVPPDQSADAVTCSCDRADGVGVLNDVFVFPDQAADVVTSPRDSAGSVGVIDDAVNVVPPDQTADETAAGDHTSGVGVCDAVAVV